MLLMRVVWADQGAGQPRHLSWSEGKLGEC